jgi:hypothetical protein
LFADDVLAVLSDFLGEIGGLLYIVALGDEVVTLFFSTDNSYDHGA